MYLRLPTAVRLTTAAGAELALHLPPRPPLPLLLLILLYHHTSTTTTAAHPSLSSST